MKSMPKIDESRKRKAEESSAPTKKAKIEVYIYSTSDWLILSTEAANTNFIVSGVKSTIFQCL
jgi:hypothetical protein